MAVNMPEWYLVESKKKSSNPGILFIEKYKYHCVRSSKKDELGTRTHFYICSERKSNGCLASANVTVVHNEVSLCNLCIIFLVPWLGDYK